MRKEIAVTGNNTTFKLCGLTPGNHYTVYTNGNMPGSNIQFQVLAGLKPGLTDFKPVPKRPNAAKFKASSDCVTLVAKALPSKVAETDHVVITVTCDDCTEDNTWKEHFWNAVEMANLSTTGGITANSLVTNTLIGGNCFDVTNITSAGNSASRGTFTNGGTNIGLNTGVVLCTGNVNILPGPNNNNGANGGFNTNSTDDPDLATLSTGNQWDLSKIEFDFTPTASMLQFNFVFGSEEYCEYVGSQFNDVFGFFISGPGISGTQNIALIPGTSTPVTINNVNHNSNTSYYVNNNNGGAACNNLPPFAINECQLDGFTTVLTATANVTPCGTYHIKLAIADIQDAAFASAVFLKANSFDAGGQAKAQPIYPAGQQFVYEDCGNTGFIRFYRGTGDASQPLVINFTVSGTATPGDDYAPLTSPITIPAGQTEILIPVTVFADLLIEGDETIVIAIEDACSCQQQNVTFTIKDKPPLDVDLNDVTICGGTSTTLTPAVTGGLSPFTYHWNTNASTQSITVNTQGTNTYTVTVTDHCGTTATAQSTVSINPSPTAALSGSGVFCAGVSNPINLTVNFTGVGPWDLTYNAAGNQTTTTFNTSPGTIIATDPGNYNLVSVVSANGCPGTVSGNVTLNQITVNLNVVPHDPPCFGANGGSINASANGGAGPFTYLWSNNATSANLTNIGPGTYSVTVTNGNGCTATQSVTLTEPPQLTATIASSGNIDCTKPQGNADLQVDGGTPSYTYHWSNNSTAEDPTFNTGGTYSVTVTDSKGCTATTSVTITANTTLPTAVIAPPAQVTCANPELTLNATGSSQGPQFEYQWNGPSFVCCETTLQPQINQGGTYSLTVTNTDNGCTKAVSVTVTQNNTPPNLNINTPPNIGCNTPTITISGAGSATGAGIVYQWTTADGNIVSGGNTLNPQVNLAGTYNLLITNGNNGCTATGSVTVSGNTIPPDAVIAPPGIVNCYTPQINLDGSGSSQGGNFTYNWSGPGGGINSGGNTLNPEVDQPGTYTLTVTNADNHCTATASVTVTSNLTIPTAVASTPPTLNCTVTNISLNGTGSSTGPDFTYLWTTNSGNIVSGETTLMPVVDQPGTYTLLVTNTLNGCTKSVVVNVSQNIVPPTININTPAHIGCNMPTITISGNGSSTGPNFGYQWTTTGGNIVSGGTTLNPQVNQAGTYTLVITNSNNGCTSTESVDVTGNTIHPVADIAPPPIVNCFSPQINLDASGSSQGGNYTYNWSGPSGGINSGGNTLNPEVDQPGNYTLTVTDTDNGCTSTASVTVQSDLVQPIAVAATPPTLTCQSPEISLNGNGSSTGANFTYEWTTGNGNIVSGETTLNPVVNQPGTYTLVVTNNTNGCTKSVTVTVPANQNFPIANAGPPQLLNCLHPTIQIQGSGSSGANFTLQWTPNPGNITAGGNTFTPTVNQAGYYTLLVTNTTNGCTAQDVVEVTENFNVPIASIAPPEILTCANPTIQLDGSASSQGSNITYQWMGTPPTGIIGGNNTDSPTINKPGVYKLTVTDTESGCTATASVTVTQNITPPTANAGPGGQLSCQMPQMTLGGTGSVGPSFEYQWFTASGNFVSGETTLNPVIDQGGTYTLVVTNADNGCTASSSVNITVNQNFPNATGGPDKEMNCQNAGIVELNATGSSTGPTYTYQWTANPGNIISGANTLKPKVNEEGYYTLLVTNTANGCTDEAEVFVLNNIVYPIPDIAAPLELNCNFATLDLDASGSILDPSGVYKWTASNGGHIVNGATTANPEIDKPGTYNLLLTNEDNYCTATASVVVTQNITHPNAAAAVNGVLTCQFPQVDLSGQGSSQGPEFFYNWSTANGNIVSGPLTLTPTVNQPGTYTLTVTNNDNGCTTTASTTVTTSQTFPTANAGNPTDLTCAITQVILNGNASSQGAQYAYVWSTPNGNIVSGGNTLTPTVNSAGTYDLSVVNLQNGCTSSASVEIGTNLLSPLAVTAPGGVLSCTQTSLALNGTGSSTGAGFTYSWTTTNGNFVSGQTGLNPVVNAVGDYTLLVTNTVNGCTHTSTTTVGADASLPTAVAGLPDTLTCSIQQITLNANSSSQGAQYAYSWTGPNIISGGNTLTPVVNKPGLYELKVTNTGNGCTAISAVSIPQDIVLPIAEAGPTAQLDCDDLTQTLDGSPSSTGALYNYLWTTTGTGHIVSGANTLVPVVDKPGVYSLLITNNFNGCTATDLVNITQDIVLPTADAGAPGLITCTNPTVTLNGTGNTGNPFTYTWTTPNGNIASGATTLHPIVDAPGDYSLLITNTNNGCTATDQVSVAKDANVPTATAAVVGELNCVVNQLTLSGANSTQGATITTTWSTTTGHIVSGGSSLSPVVDKPGAYTLTIFNTANNCVASSTVNVNLNLAPPTADAGSPAIISCQNPVLTLNGTASSQGTQYSYNWSTVTGNIITSNTILTPKVDQSGFYTIQVTDSSNGCTATSTVQIVLDQNTPESNPGASPTLTCAVTSLSLNGTASSVGNQFSYVWTTNNGHIVSGANTLTPTIDKPGTYKLLVSNALNGCSALDSVKVNQNIVPPNADAGAIPTLTCAVTSLNLDGTASSNGNNQFTYLWTTGNGQIISGNTTMTPSIGDPGYYLLKVTDVINGCIDTAGVQVKEDVVPPLAASAVAGELTCAVTTLPLSGTGSSTGAIYQYQWSTTGGQIIDGPTTLAPHVGKPGNYKLLVTNTQNGCTTTSNVTVTQNITPPQADAGATNQLTCTVLQVNLAGTGSGGVNGVSYSWSGPGIVSGGNTTSPTVNALGTYKLLVTDLYNGCTARDSVKIIPNTTPPVITIANPALLTCQTGTVPISGNGSSTGTQFSYAWSGPGIVGGNNTLNIMANVAGVYKLTITNTLNGCTSEQSANLQQDVSLPIA
ncbi:MAG: choice-of-anchor L domain-containing protein, partial [Bacteroidota bacterium]